MAKDTFCQKVSFESVRPVIRDVPQQIGDHAALDRKMAKDTFSQRVSLELVVPVIRDIPKQRSDLAGFDWKSSIGLV